MTKPNPNNKYPKKAQAAAIATKAMAAKNHRRFIYSARYLMKNMPKPVVTLRSAFANQHQWPAQPGLTKGRTISAQEVHELTIRMIVNAQQNRTDLQMSCQTFLKAVKPYLPPSLCLNSDWANFRSRNCSDPKVDEVAKDLEDFAKEYFVSIETQLASLYLTVGDKVGAQYLKILERRFRETWGTGTPSTVRFNATVGQNKTDVEEEEDKPKDTSVTFNFEVVQTGSQEAS